MNVMSSVVDANLDNIKKLEGDSIQHCDGSMNVMSRVVDANLDNIKKLEGDRIQHCDGSFGLSHVDEISSLVIQGNCCHHAVIGCWLAVLALPLCRHELLVTVMQQHQGHELAVTVMQQHQGHGQVCVCNA